MDEAIHLIIQRLPRILALPAQHALSSSGFVNPVAGPGVAMLELPNHLALIQRQSAWYRLIMKQVAVRVHHEFKTKFDIPRVIQLLSKQWKLQHFFCDLYIKLALFTVLR